MAHGIGFDRVHQHVELGPSHATRLAYTSKCHSKWLDWPLRLCLVMYAFAVGALDSKRLLLGHVRTRLTI